MKEDRFLIAILVFIGLLVAAAVGLFFIRQDTATYVADDNPEGVVHNYILAMQEDDFQKAYSYIHQTENTPDYETFRTSFLKNIRYEQDIALSIGKVKRIGDEAVVDLIIIHGGSGPFNSSWRETQSSLLVLEDEEWKIVNFPYPYWNWDWYPRDPGG